MYALLSIFLHKLPWLSPGTTYEAAQLVSSKLLVFGVLVFMLVLCARNFLAHTHNQIVNKHRQNALLTFQALVDAARAGNARDIVLTHAAACIFDPQDTGYSRPQGGTRITLLRRQPVKPTKQAEISTNVLTDHPAGQQLCMR